MEETIKVDITAIEEKNIKETLKKIVEDLNEIGYDPVKQITGYLISGDPGYISSYKECRTRILELNRNSVIEIMIESYLK